MEEIKDYIEVIQEESHNLKNKQIIDDIFDISKGLYNTYDDYVKYKQEIIDDIKNFNKECLTIKENCYRFTYYIEPIIISEHDFNYIVSKYLHKLR